MAVSGLLTDLNPRIDSALTYDAFASSFRALFEADPVRPDERPSLTRRIARRNATRVPASFVFIRSPSGAETSRNKNNKDPKRFGRQAHASIRAET